MRRLFVTDAEIDARVHKALVRLLGTALEKSEHNIFGQGTLTIHHTLRVLSEALKEQG